MFPRSSRSFSSDFKLLYGVISVFYVQSQVLRPPFFFTTSYRITRRLEPGVTWYLFSCLRVQTEKKKGISLNCKFRIVPSVSRIETAISRSHPQPSRGRVFFFFFSCARRTHMQTHTPLCVDFHKLFPHNVISGNQLDGIFWDDDSSDESSLLSLTFFHTKGRERECREKEQEEEKRRSWQYADEFTTWRVGMMHKPDLWLLNKSVVLHSNSLITLMIAQRRDYDWMRVE